jgi:hypothetical protein
MSTRLGLALGLALAGAIAVWWLGASRVAIEGGVETSLLAGQALFVVGLLRGMLIAVLAPRSAAVGGYVAGLRCSLPVVTAAWPLVALAWAASNAGIALTLGLEAALVAGAAAASLIGRGLARGLKQGPAMEAIATAVGVSSACCLWLIAVHSAP